MEMFELEDEAEADREGEEVEEDDPNLEPKDGEDARRPFGASSSTLDLLQVPWQELAYQSHGPHLVVRALQLRSRPPKSWPKSSRRVSPRSVDSTWQLHTSATACLLVVMLRGSP